jgi:hypothetical protein
MGTPGNSHAGSPYMHMGGLARMDAAQYGDYVPMGSTSSGGSNDFHQLPPQQQQQQQRQSGSVRGYQPSARPPSGLSQPYSRPAAGGGGGVSTDFQRSSFRNGLSDYQSTTNQQQQRPGTASTPGPYGNQTNPAYANANSVYAHTNSAANASYANRNSNSYGNNYALYPSNDREVQKQVQGWYQQKLMEAAQRLRNSTQYTQHSAESDQSEGGFALPPVRYDPVHGSDV